MQKILILGMSTILGGVETYIYNLIKNIDRDMYYFDFLVVGDGVAVFHDEINSIINDGRDHFYYAPNLKKNYLKTKKWLELFYKNHRYDLIYMNTCSAARINYCEYPVKKFKTPLISHAHSGNASSKLHIISNKLYRDKLTRMSTVKLACSELAYNWIFSDEESKGIIVPNGVDLDRFKFDPIWRKKIRETLKIKDDEILVGNVGRFTIQKNQSYLLKLSKKLGDKYKIIIIGDGELKNQIIEEIKKENLENRIIILPAKNNIEKYYSAMDIFVMPSNFEGLPIAAVEAQAEGLPCIFSTNISRQTALSKNSVFLPLEDMEAWERMIENFSGLRYDGTLIIREKGSDSMQSAQLVGRIFQNINEKCNE